MSEMQVMAERLLQLANDEGTAQIHDVAIEISRLVGFQERELERLRGLVKNYQHIEAERVKEALR